MVSAAGFFARPTTSHRDVRWKSSPVVVLLVSSRPSAEMWFEAIVNSGRSDLQPAASSGVFVRPPAVAAAKTAWLCDAEGNRSSRLRCMTWAGSGGRMAGVRPVAPLPGAPYSLVVVQAKSSPFSVLAEHLASPFPSRPVDIEYSAVLIISSKS